MTSLDPIIHIERRLPMPTEGCWLWPGANNGQGYGQINVELPDGRRAPRYVHRLMYEAHVGPIPAGFTLDHLCRTPQCARPTHLEAVPEIVNIRRGMGPAAILWRRDECARGHARSATNTTIRPNGLRRCIPCSNDYAERQRRARGAPIRVFTKPRERSVA